MSDVFISYSHKDKSVAEKFARLIESNGMTVFWDKQIPPGKTYDQFIKEQLDKSRCIVVLWSANSVVSDWVKEEASRGIVQTKLVPVLIEPIEPPLGFGRIEAAELYHWAGSTGDAGQQDQAELANLLQAITTMMASSSGSDAATSSASGQVGGGTAVGSWKPTKPVTQPAIPFGKPTADHKGKAIGIGALVAIVAVAAIAISRPKQDKPPVVVPPLTPPQTTGKESVQSPASTQPTSPPSPPSPPSSSTSAPPPIQPPIQPPPPNPSTTAIVSGNSGTKNLRSGPGTRYGIVTEIATGETVEVLGSSSDVGGYPWTRVRTADGTEAWIASHLLTIQ